MTTGPDGTSTSLTVAQAAAAIERLLPVDDDTEEPSGATPTPDESEAPAEEEQESPDATEEESEPSDAEEESEEDDESEDGDAPEPKTYRVKVDGEEVEVTEEELLRGYSRTQDYTRKTQKLAEERRAFEAEVTAVRSERQRYAELLTQLEEALADAAPPEPDWGRLRAEDPTRFAVAWAEWQQHQQRVEAVQAEKRQTLEQLAQDQRAAYQQHLAAEQAKLLEALPAWRDEAVAQREKAELIEFARAAGYRDEEIAAVTDHRVLLLLRKAMLYDRAQSQKPKIAQRIEKVRTATPGSAAGQRRPNPAKDARKRLAKTGSVHDAAAAFLDLED